MVFDGRKPVLGNLSQNISCHFNEPRHISLSYLNIHSIYISKIKLLSFFEGYWSRVFNPLGSHSKDLFVLVLCV